MKASARAELQAICISGVLFNKKRVKI